MLSESPILRGERRLDIWIVPVSELNVREDATTIFAPLGSPFVPLVLVSKYSATIDNPLETAGMVSVF
jgi:hypothetical protein